MIAINIFLVVVVLVVIGSIVYSVNNKAAIKAKTGPNVELAHAVRILDRILAADKLYPSIPQELSNEATKFVSTFYKEIES